MSADGIPAGARIDTLGAADDAVAVFQIEGQPVRGRIARLADSLDQVLSSHDYPEAVARLLGEAVIAAALVGHSLKFEGRLILQASGDGPVSFLVADYRTARGDDGEDGAGDEDGTNGGAVRAYARVDPARAVEIGPDWRADRLLGQGTLAMTIDPADDKDRYQGIVSLDGESLAEAVEAYFRQSEQIPTRLRAAVGRFQAEGLPRWRGGGMIIQQIAGDTTRGEAEDAWNTARILFGTLQDDELIDPDLSGGRVLFRLFHETGVRLFAPTPVRRYCQCSAERVKTVLGSFPAAERAAMHEDGGAISATCEYCNRTYRFTEADF